MIPIDDRMAILDLCARYNYAVDTCAAEEWADTFTADGTFGGPAGSAEGREQLVAFCFELNEMFPGAMHFNDNHLFEPDGKVMRHKCFLSMQTPGEDGTSVMALGYEDEVVKEGGEWRFKSRRVGPLTGA